MAFDIKRVEYYNTTVEGHVGEASRLLSVLAGVGVDLLGYKAVPLEPMRTRFTFLAVDGAGMIDGAEKAGLNLDGPHPALYVQGDEEPGALAGVYEKLSQAGVDVSESNGMAHIRGGYGVILNLEQEERERAIAALRSPGSDHL